MEFSKLIAFSGALLGFCMASTLISHAGWEQLDDDGWKYKDDSTGQYCSSGWQWIDSNGDGLSESYYFDIGGRLLTNTTTPDGYSVNNDGAWTVDGVVQTQSSIRNPGNAWDLLSNEEKITEFTDSWKGYLEQLVILIQQNNHLSVLSEMEGIKYNSMIDRLPEDGFCYMINDNIGLKLCSKYLYYGNIVDGNANGTGNMYMIHKNYTKIRYGYFIGEWKNDMPNGQGEEFIYFKSGGYVHNTGKYIDWYQDGEMTSEYFESRGYHAIYHYIVKDKFPVGIGQTKNGRGEICTVVAYPEPDPSSGYLTFYDTAQTALYYPIDDGISKNARGYWVLRR